MSLRAQTILILLAALAIAGFAHTVITASVVQRLQNQLREDIRRISREQIDQLAKDIAVNVPMGIWVTKQAFWHNMNAGSLEQAMEFETRGVFMAQSTEDAKEKRAAFLEKRDPKFSSK